MTTAAMTQAIRSATRIGIDGDALRKPLSGVGQYVYNLCRELDLLLPEAQFFVYTRLAPDRVALPSERWVVRQEPMKLARKLPSFIWLKTRGAKLAQRDALDVFWAGRTIHPGTHVAQRTLVTVHDLNHRLVPKTMEWATRLSHLLWFDSDVRSADTIFSNSQGTSDRLLRWVGRSADVVIHPGVRADFHPINASAREAALASLQPLGIVPPYVLAVSTLEPRKNIGMLVEAFVKLKNSGALAEHKLVLVGAKGWQNKELAQKIEDNANLGIVLPGYVPDELMPAVFALADVLVMPSLYEGFGMPVLEARAVGTPVIVSDIPELKEAADGQGEVVAPQLDELEKALLHMQYVPVEERQRANGEIFTWANSALRMRDFLTVTP